MLCDMEIEKLDNTGNSTVQTTTVSKKKSKKRSKKGGSGGPKEAELNGGDEGDEIYERKIVENPNENNTLELTSALKEKLHISWNGVGVGDNGLINGDNIKVSENVVVNSSLINSNQNNEQHDNNDRIIENGCDKLLSLSSSKNVSETQEISPLEYNKTESSIVSSSQLERIKPSLSLELPQQSLVDSQPSTSSASGGLPEIEYKEYESELQMPDIIRLIQKDLSEPYSIYTYRYFIHNWPKLCFLAVDDGKCVGAVVCKLDRHRNLYRGYIAMLAVDKDYRKLKIGTNLVQKAIQVCNCMI